MILIFSQFDLKPEFAWFLGTLRVDLSTASVHNLSLPRIIELNTLFKVKPVSLIFDYLPAMSASKSTVFYSDRILSLVEF